MQDEYHALSYKTMALWRMAEEQFDVQYLIKVDDDNYVRLDRLAVALGQWHDLGAGMSYTYAACMASSSLQQSGRQNPQTAERF